MVLKHAHRIWDSESLRRKILFTIGVVLVYKLLSQIPVPGVNIAALDQIRAFLAANQGLAFFSALMGGGVDRFSVVLMGLAPYINAVIIMQLLAVIVPRLEAIKKEGEQGQRRINNYTRWLTVPLAFAQSYGMILLLNTLLGQQARLIDTHNFFGAVLPAMLFITAGTVFLMWLGDLISEQGLGNGTSIVIFAGVLTGVPTHIMNYLAVGNIGLLIGLTALTLAVTFIIIRFTEGHRKIPLIYTRTGRDERSYFPIRINQAGMIPIIFAVSIVTFPALIGQILSRQGTTGMASEIGQFLVSNFSMNNPSIPYIVIYFLLVLAFSFFYVSITFNTTEIAESIQKRGGYIPSVRPGRETAEYLEKISMHLNLFGGSFLALIAIFPYVATKAAPYMGIDMSGGANIDFLISGAGLIIVVGVILDLIRRVDSELKSYDYKRFY